jgi:hypothetical protein
VATIASLLREHVTLQVRSVDRIFLHGSVPRLMCEGQLVSLLLATAAEPGDGAVRIPSPALLGKIGRAYVAQVERFAHRQGIPLVRFEKRASKEELARP